MTLILGDRIIVTKTHCNNVLMSPHLNPNSPLVRIPDYQSSWVLRTNSRRITSTDRQGCELWNVGKPVGQRFRIRKKALVFRVAEVGSLSLGAKMAMQIFVKRVFTIFATNASFLCAIANLQI